MQSRTVNFTAALPAPPDSPVVLWVVQGLTIIGVDVTGSFGGRVTLLGSNGGVWTPVVVRASNGNEIVGGGITAPGHYTIDVAGFAELAIGEDDFAGTAALVGLGLGAK